MRPLTAAARRRARIAIAIATASLVVTAWCGSAWAQSNDAANRQAAAEAYDHGTASFLQHDYAAAANWFETADRLAPALPALLSAIRAHREAGGIEHFARAATLAARLRAQYVSDARAQQTADETITQLSPQLGRLTVQCEGCTLEIDGVLQSSHDVFVVPGAHRVTAHWSHDRSATESPSLPAGTQQPLHFETPPEPVVATAAPSETPPSSSGPTPRAGSEGGAPRGITPIVFVTGAVLTVACAGVLVWSGLDALDRGHQLIQYATDNHQANPALESAAQSAEIRTDVLAVATGVLGVATIATIFVTRWHTRTDRAVAVAPSAGLHGAGLSLTGRF